MTEDVMDPPEPPEAAEGCGLRAKNLKNTPIVVKPTKIGNATGKDGDPYEYIACDVWVLDRAGVIDTGTDVQISWWRAKEQLRNAIGRYIPCRPVEQDDRSVILVPLKDEARKVADQVVDDIKGTMHGAADEPSSDPF